MIAFFSSNLKISWTNHKQKQSTHFKMSSLLILITVLLSVNLTIILLTSYLNYNFHTLLCALNTSEVIKKVSLLFFLNSCLYQLRTFVRNKNNGNTRWEEITGPKTDNLFILKPVGSKSLYSTSTTWARGNIPLSPVLKLMPDKLKWEMRNYFVRSWQIWWIW